MTIIDGKFVAEQIKTELKNAIAPLIESGKRVPGLVTILVGQNHASRLYVTSKAEACKQIGMNSKIEVLPENVTEDELLQLIKKYNDNPDYHGILVQLPLPQHLNEQKVINCISPSKDVDGFHPENVGKLVIGIKTFMPCTPAGIQELLKRYSIPTVGKHFVVVGRSNIVGKPIANIMLQKADYANSVVTVCHSAAPDLRKFTLSADILVSAIGKPNFITKEMVPENCTVIDVGINRIPDVTAKKGYRIVGDVDYENVAPKTAYITPVPGGVGPMTIAMLLKNTYESFLNS